MILIATCLQWRRERRRQWNHEHDDDDGNEDDEHADDDHDEDDEHGDDEHDGDDGNFMTAMQLEWTCDWKSKSCPCCCTRGGKPQQWRWWG